MDNIPFHHSKEVVSALTLKGVSILYALSYSPRINPVETVFGMLKPIYREKCPPEFNSKFDYKLLFETILTSRLKDISLENYFMHVRKIAVDTISQISI
jgi:transposase